MKQIEKEMEIEQLRLAEQQTKRNQEKYEMIERLIKNGTNPVAARCAILGKSTGLNTPDITCAVAAVGKTISIPTE